MRAVSPAYNNNEEIRYENKKNHKKDGFRTIINDDYGNHK